MICNSNYLSLTPKLLLTHNFWWECHWALKIHTQVLCTLLCLWGKGTQRPLWNPTSPLPQFCVMANQETGRSPDLDVGGGDNERPCLSISSTTVHTGLEIKWCCLCRPKAHATTLQVESREWERLAGSRTVTASNSGNTWPSCVFIITKSGQEESVPRGRQVAMLTLGNPLSKGHLFYLNILIPSVSYNKACVNIITLYDDFINPCFYSLEIYLVFF